MPRRDSLLTRSLEPLLALLWPLFLVWSAAIALLWTTGLAPEQITAAIANHGLRDALLAISRAADTLWLLLAAANLYVALAERVGLGTARLWAIVIGATAAVIALASVRTGWPLGPVLYTTRFGMKLGDVPLGWPVWWFVVVIGGRMFAERLFPRASHPQLAFATGVVALLTQFNLDPLAWKLRAFWLWDVPGMPPASFPPWRNFVTWWLVATALAFLLRERQVIATAHPPPWPRALILILMNAVFVLTHVTVAFRH
jgi:uncharacterized membrane protein